MSNNKRGPRKPVELKKLNGTYRKDRDGGAVQGRPQPKSEIPDCPSHLTKEAKKEWKRVTTELNRLGLITALDRTVIAIYCSAYAEEIEASADIAENGVVIETKYGPQKNPYVGIRDKARQQVKQFGKEIGVGHLSRRGITPKPPEKRENPFSKIGR